MSQIQRVAVLGAGVMGATIAAHLANAGLSVLLLDMPPKEGSNKNEVATKALAQLAKSKPAALYLQSNVNRVTAGNFEDDLGQLQSCDWVVEVIIENLEIKRAFYRDKVVPYLGAHTILSSNSSGLSVQKMAEVLPLEVQQRFLLTHFFNPPRYMRLMELAPCAATKPEVMATMAEFLGAKLGKGIVYAKDTPNFVANRIGVFSIFNAMLHMTRLGLTIEEVDSIAGPATGRPKSAAFRTSDLVGLDTLVHVGNNSYQNLPQDEQRETFKIPDFLAALVAQGQLGDKTGAGFYKKGKGPNGEKIIFYWDTQEKTYKPQTKPKFASIGANKMLDGAGEKIKALVMGQDQAAQFAWANLRDTLIYSFNRLGEIADDIVNIDNAMRWGFNWELGPFEMLDAIGVKEFTQKARQEGVNVPEGLGSVERFYRYEGATKQFWDVQSKSYQPVPLKPGQIELFALKKGGKEALGNSSASLIDLGDGVFNLEFHSKMNTIGGDILGFTLKAVDYVAQNGLGMVITNQGANFSVGANLALLTAGIAEGEWDDINLMIRSFQKATNALKYSPFPTVAAPFHLALGGGCEYSLHADAINAYSETYMGLVEVGVGLLPAGGGTKEMCIRAVELGEQFETDPSPFLFKYFRQIAMAGVSTSAEDLFGMGYMRPGDQVTMDLDRLVFDAKQKVLALAANYRPKTKRINIPAPGRSVAATLKSQVWNLIQGGYASEHDGLISNLVADVICGGDVPPGTLVSEDYLLELEREAFLKLCGTKKTFERISFTLKTGKPLRN
ncbi:MAG: 3-hydroxyacyl-CoA dehydrogenase [Candidatus Lambdaproteobacteria bacterium RIFOXYD1_FULL_56_27]|uniref:3-hydroxyacyl-CoA dehydrogenase n=1 Tax=Candidatus Lambdaproteobacteria bacterium RIFOXYD2_FULL_56_26 TaxID=1817773 RepID=A0A1F6GZU3_9PROT|nr:MAG: 3-hydroxyacyl-CoA dehydrogenase [Candidatus Lambdaproteobacteria bacterium RIFOXYC1_FULL_56_13]OGH03609.1 MAG: 3-hydroxyacyl-CoA dehydrogenase [Candidatus Lambdaproteobacteria bacterium RIFOXYD2_FULL_56_26]OGH06796.1 MAG: 3-hydroxyacyl-CoA dehydrogenase [Candidatus Lambdaproteobacteria bacterium RIFOXYD1_FULL_56_27]